MTTIAVLVGSLRSDSFNLRLAKSVERMLPEGVEFVYANLKLPLFNQDLEADFPGDATALKQLVEGADGVLFVTPEYNRSFPGVLKNAIDWGSRPWGQNSFAGKPAAIIGASGGALGATQAQAALRNVLLFLDMKIMGQPEVYFNALTGFDEKGNLVPAAEGFIKTFTDAFVSHVQGAAAAGK
ncbi:NADPH-dependent FMN reductase [Bifidobacterium sp.]|jgi:chromate reductase|uniref:NADPH-dependent FMN reductase n=1 Tax=Bifidobacterium sp. TaxID=41200 RepID=UPI0025BA80ED|nr:NAD(P)H-dependent oxidoreductase [Bifidobacterium sp.]MCH4209627.1 NAD(P)H-dependent oxidoreductase [Bifidobacterium sp.]MCI1224846.1 NAD(P)H-dependent oxidoreductase [Bifidobacterium sp.]